MLYAIYCLDDPLTPGARDQNYPAHRSFLAAPPRPILLAGPLLEEGTDRRIGSLLVIEAPSMADAIAFSQADPFFINKVWERIEVRPFVKAIDNR